MSDYIYRVVLKQHTPIIHFQHQQAGATLRVSELKPKLDAYLIKKIGDQNIKPEWRVGTSPESRLALDYRVKINKRSDANSYIDIDTLKGFFGNMGKAEDEKIQCLYSKDDIIVIFLFSNAELKKHIESNFAEFLSITNFGTRQSKGFGSFFPKGLMPESPLLLYKFTLHNIPTDNYQILFKKIDWFYRTLRSGLNVYRINKNEKTPVFYFKSLLFVYAHRSKINWEKRFIKEKMFGSFLRDEKKHEDKPPLIQQNPSNNGYDVRLMRDVLGLSSKELWLSYGKANLKKEHEDIERFASPLFFKPVQQGNDFVISLGVRDNAYEFENYNGRPMKYLGEKIKITTEDKWNNKKEEEIKLPKNFDLRDYLRYTFESLDLNTHIPSQFLNSNDKSTKEILEVLKSIYQQLRKQV